MKRASVKPAQFQPEAIQAIQEAVFALVESQLDPRFFLVDVAFEKEAGYWYLRIFVDLKEGSIALNECEALSRELEPAIEALPILVDLSYNLEMSSPGLFRPVKTEREFNFYQGEPVRVVGPAPAVKNAKKAARALPSDLPAIAEGILQGYDLATHALSLKNPTDGSISQIALSDEQTVYLNPTIRFPEEDANDEALDSFEESASAECPNGV